MNPDWSLTTLSTKVPFDTDGRHFGDLRLVHSDNRYATGYIPIPLAVLRHGDGPTLLLTGGTHGDEYEGPAAILRLAHDLDLATLRGRIIALPALNAPAFYANTRVSPIDNGNLNRVFPGRADGTPTEMIAHCVEHALIPCCDAVIDLHSGGKASFYIPSVLVNRPPDETLLRRNLELARAFGAELLWVLGGGLKAGSVNGAAARQGVPMVATELAGGGALTRAALQVGIDGIRNVMIQLGMLEGSIPQRAAPPAVEAWDNAAVYAPTAGVFEAYFEPGQVVAAGTPAGRLYPVPDFERAPIDLVFPYAGIVIARIHPGLVERGAKLAFVGRDAGLGTLWE
jgi:predicted deacylase